MHSSRLPYTDYQQVLSFNTEQPKSRKRPLAGVVSPSSLQFKVIKLGNAAKAKPTNKRTRTGCLTCRQRKKKCDEHKINGKCQACTRNFLTCGWPGDAIGEDSVKTGSESLLSPLKNYAKISVAELCAPTTPEKAYPSPIASPTMKSCLSPSTEVALLILPPACLYKADKQKTFDSEQHEFIVTSYNSKRDLCLV